MIRARHAIAHTLAAAAVLAAAPRLHAQTKPTIAQFLSPASPLELASAANVDRVAWVTYERGMRNVYTAAAPKFTPVRLTRFLADDGTDLSDVTISADGSAIAFVRGSAPNRAGWVANPTHDPNGAERAIWAVRTAGGPAFRLAEGSAPEISPDGRFVLYVKDGQIYRLRATQHATTSQDTGGVPFIKEWGRQSSPSWSPDGSKIAFVSDRGDHSFIGIYDVKSRTVDFLAPSVDFDFSPSWSPDGKRIAFIRKPGLAFGQQLESSAGDNSRGRAGSPFARRRYSVDTAAAAPDGLHRAAFPGGYTLSLMIADADTRRAHEVWHDDPADHVFANMNAIRWVGDHLVFGLNVVPNDEYERYYSIRIAAPRPEPVLLTTTNGLIENSASVGFSRDGKTMFYSTNAGDIERRHIWSVPVAGGTPVRVTSGDGIETFPHPLASGRNLAVLYYGAAQPASVGIVPASGGKAHLVFPTLPRDFPVAAHVTPQIVITKAPDGLTIHNQLFLPKDLKPGERRPAIVFVHGGPMRQMLPGYHYMQFYHWAYAVNQWLASQGYVVMSINYRSGIGYGRSFRHAPNTEGRGNSEYQDVLAGAKYLQTRADVDPARIGIWGLSYGGLLTSEALARNSDVFVAGADLAGVHLYGRTIDSTALAYQSSAAAHVDTWKSPVFLVQGDDDRNVAFSQMVGLVQLLRAQGVHYELTVIPDDVHESLIHARWIDTFERMGDFLHRYVWDKGQAAAANGGR